MSPAPRLDHLSASSHGVVPGPRRSETTGAVDASEAVETSGLSAAHSPPRQESSLNRGRVGPQLNTKHPASTERRNHTDARARFSLPTPALGRRPRSADLALTCRNTCRSSWGETAFSGCPLTTLGRNARSAGLRPTGHTGIVGGRRLSCDPPGRERWHLGALAEASVTQPYVAHLPDRRRAARRRRPTRARFASRTQTPDLPSAAATDARHLRPEP